MREVGVHFEYEIVTVVDGILKPGDVSGTESEFTGTLNDENTAWVLCYFVFNDSSSTVRRVVVYNEDVKIMRKSDNGVDDSRRVLFLVVHWYNNKAVAHKRKIFGAKVQQKANKNT